MDRKNCADVISSVEIKDRCEGDFISYPRFTLTITWNCTYDENEVYLDPMVCPFYHWNGKRKIDRHVDVEWHYKDDNRFFSFVPDEDEIAQVYGWKYKLFSKLIPSK